MPPKSKPHHGLPHHIPLPPILQGRDALDQIREELRRATLMYRASRDAMLAVYSHITHVRTLLHILSSAQNRHEALRSSLDFYLTHVQRVIDRLEKRGILDEARTLAALSQAMRNALSSHTDPE